MGLLDEDRLFPTDPRSRDLARALYEGVRDLPILARPAFRPRALFERFNIEAIATTEAATDDLRWHAMIRDSGWRGRVITA